MCPVPFLSQCAELNMAFMIRLFYDARFSALLRLEEIRVARI
jgi:hypothetical protein